MFLSPKKTELLFFGLCFVSLFIFFSYVHPLVPYDGDDWYFLAAAREPYPCWGAWNPVKVLPETVMPLCGYLSAYFLRHIVGDYVSSITVCSALIISSAITVYFYSFYRLIDLKFDLPLKGSLLSVLLLVLFHFMIFKSHQFNNLYMFYSSNLTCYFHYCLPALVNSVLVLYLFSIDDFLTIDITKNGMMILALYLAIFSNIYHSVILAVYVFVRLARAYFKNSDKHSCYSISFLKEFVRNNCGWFIVMAVWFLSLFFEAHGGRANQIGHSIFTLPLKQTLICCGHLLKQISVNFGIVLFIILWSARVIYLKSKNKDCTDFMYRDIVVQSLFCLGLVLVYTVLVSAKANPYYMANADVAISFLFYLFVILCFSIAYILKRVPKVIKVFPLICFIIAVQTFNSDSHFRESNTKNIAPSKCIAVDNNIVKQIIEADRAGKKKMILVVPKGNNHDNWPHPVYMGPNISKTLFTHGIISQMVDISIKPDENMNMRFHLGNK